jgi:hypothetical protein
MRLSQPHLVEKGARSSGLDEHGGLNASLELYDPTSDA